MNISKINETGSKIQHLPLLVTLLAILALLVGSAATPAGITGQSSAVMTEGVTPTEPPPDNARVSPPASGLVAPFSFNRPQAILLTEGFEGRVMPPVDWLNIATIEEHTWKIMIYGSTHSGDEAADVEYDDELEHQNEWLLSPAMILSQGTLIFWSRGSLYYCRDDYDNCDLNIWLVLNDVGGGDDIFVDKADDDWTDTWAWSQSSFNLNPFLPLGKMRIGFQYDGENGAQIALDDISLDGTGIIFRHVYLPVVKK